MTIGGTIQTAMVITKTNGYGNHEKKYARSTSISLYKIAHSSGGPSLAGRTADQIRAGHQLPDRKGARVDYTAGCAHHRRRGDRMTRPDVRSETLHILGGAMDEAGRRVKLNHLNGGANAARTVRASHIFAMATKGERDPQRLIADALMNALSGYPVRRTL